MDEQVTSAYSMPRSVVISPDGNYAVATLSWVDTMISYSITSGALQEVTDIFTGSYSGPWLARFSPDGAQIVLLAHGVFVYHFSAGYFSNKQQIAEHGSLVVFSPNGGLCLVGRGSQLFLFIVVNGEFSNVQTVDLPEGRNLQTLVFSPDGEYVVARSGIESHDAALDIFQVVDGSLASQSSYTLEHGELGSVAPPSLEFIHADLGVFIAAVLSNTGTVALLNFQSGRIEGRTDFELPAGSGQTKILSFVPDGSYLLVSDTSGAVITFAFACEEPPGTTTTTGVMTSTSSSTSGGSSTSGANGGGNHHDSSSGGANLNVGGIIAIVFVSLFCFCAFLFCCVCCACIVFILAALLTLNGAILMGKLFRARSSDRVQNDDLEE